MGETAVEMRYRQEAAMAQIGPYVAAAYGWLSKVALVASVHLRSGIEGWDRRRLKRELRRPERSTYSKSPALQSKHQEPE